MGFLLFVRGLDQCGRSNFSIVLVERGVCVDLLSNPGARVFSSNLVRSRLSSFKYLHITDHIF